MAVVQKVLHSQTGMLTAEAVALEAHCTHGQTDLESWVQVVLHNSAEGIRVEGALDNWVAELEGMVVVRTMVARRLLEGHMLMGVVQIDMGSDRIGRMGDGDLGGLVDPAAGDYNLHSYDEEDRLEDHSQYLQEGKEEHMTAELGGEAGTFAEVVGRIVEVGLVVEGMNRYGSSQ